MYLNCPLKGNTKSINLLSNKATIIKLIEYFSALWFFGTLVSALWLILCHYCKNLFWCSSFDARTKPNFFLILQK